MDSGRIRFLILIAALWGMLSFVATPAMCDVRGDMRSIGAGDYLRIGSWMPIRVELALENQISFDGNLLIRQRDADGDYMVHKVPVHLQADSGPQRSYWLYTVVNSRNDLSKTEVFLEASNGYAMPMRNSSGEVSTSLTLGARGNVLDDSDYLILVLTRADRTAGRISRLSAPDQASRFWKTIKIAHVTPDSFPSMPIGLDAVDCIVWEDADADSLRRPQLDSLVEWVRQGGNLFIASSTTTDTLVSSDLIEPLLPVKPGKLQSTEGLKSFWDLMMPLPDGVVPSKTTGVVPSTVKKGARALLREEVLHSDSEPEQDVLIARWPVGNGQVTWQGLTVRDALQYGGGVPSYFGRVLGLRLNQNAGDEGLDSVRALFPEIQNTVGFSQVGGVYLIIAFLFALFYIGVSTFGTWGVLNARKKAHYNWTVFAGVAIVASLLSTIGVQYVRGFGQKLHQLTVVDRELNGDYAVANTWLGLKTGTHTQLDLWLPHDRYDIEEPELSRATMLRPLANIDRGSGQTSFTDPAEYAIQPTESELTGIPFRATIKQFSGTWHGDLPQKLTGSVKIERGKRLQVSNAIQGITDDESSQKWQTADVIAEGSTITNNLGYDLVDCYLFQAERNAFEGTRLNCFSPRGMEVPLMAFAHPVGVIRNGESVDLGKRIYTNASGKAISPKEWLKSHSLNIAQKSWAQSLKSTFSVGTSGNREFVTSDYQKALLLMTLLDEYPQATLHDNFSGTYTVFSAQGCRKLNISDRLTRDSVILVGFSNDPGPVTLCTRGTGDDEYEPLTPSQAVTMYRFVIPVSGSRK